ncbi:restriction endonuclease subunit S [Bacteroides ovatus]|nr:restriction endonuclease subunit S [Bacteroides ovatus]KAA4586270.1 restriction endonuclease subunit S [Bacteroides ovatus]KAA4607642.1 restriction endonuclease subunit S [Bacteroides ovatus]KAA4620342.1 restriction endonuclease subunit S [Bacteroides ovatus]KAA4652099.1 restriction endonuclease subunit S [Bacteroides ovatus]
MPFKVPEVWVWTTLGEILELVSGQDFPPEKYNANIAGIPYIIGASNIENEQLIINRWTESPSVYSYLNDLLVVCKGAGVGKMAINNIGVAHIARQIQAVRGYTNYTDIKYIKAVVKNNIENIISKANGLIPGLKRELLLSLQLPLPPISEQRRIVCEIERWFFLIDQIEQGKADLQTVIKQAKSKILDLAIHGKLVPQNPNDEPAIELLKRINPDFTPCDNRHYTQLPNGWCTTTLKDLCENINGLWKGKKEPFVHVGVIRNANFTKDFKLDYSNIEYIDVEQRTFTKRHLMNGDLIVEKSGGSDNNPVGRTILYEGEGGVFSFSNFTMVLRIKYSNTILSKFLYYYILAIYQTGAMRLMQTQTTGLHNLILDKFLLMPIYLPPSSEQKRIIDKIEMIFATLDMIMESL